MKIILFSFGFKHGHPEADLVMDIRFLPNPYWEPELKAHSGLAAPVAAYVLESAAGKEFLEQLESFLVFLFNKHREVGRTEMSCAVGCTGGRHRSVAVTEHLRHILANKLLEHNDELIILHRDIDKK